MQGSTQVRGRGRDAPVHMDGYESETHRGGRPPKGRVVARLLETPPRPRLVMVTLDDGARQRVIVNARNGNA